MRFIETKLEGVKLIEPTLYGDNRGFFMETYRQDIFETECGKYEFVQDNHSRSVKGTLRGLHYQTEQSQGKLVRVISGKIYDVVVDMRKNSSSFGCWLGVELSSENYSQLWVPPGLAHGFYVRSDTAEFVYKCTDFYHPESEVSLKWDDNKLSIDWPICKTDELKISEKDKNGIHFDTAYKFDW